MRIILFLMIGLLLSSCKEDEVPPTRTYFMGFQNSGPQYDNVDLVLQSLNIWTQRADAAMITTEVPWEELLNGMTVNDYVINNYKGLVDFYRTKKNLNYGFTSIHKTDLTAQAMPSICKRWEKVLPMLICNYCIENLPLLWTVF